uniref:Uncharacterized protein n=1 Tax=Schistocephalus solidus TaxID=70667 RepID=A0A0V0J4Q7_SCHSO
MQILLYFGVIPLQKVVHRYIWALVEKRFVILEESVSLLLRYSFKQGMESNGTFPYSGMEGTFSNFLTILQLFLAQMTIILPSEDSDTNFMISYFYFHIEVLLISNVSNSCRGTRHRLSIGKQLSIKCCIKFLKKNKVVLWTGTSTGFRSMSLSSSLILVYPSSIRLSSYCSRKYCIPKQERDDHLSHGECYN